MSGWRATAYRQPLQKNENERDKPKLLVGKYPYFIGCVAVTIFIGQQQ